MNMKKKSTVRKVVTILFVLSLMVTQWGIGSAKAAQCTVEQGDLFIETGQYSKAVKEFTCVIDAQPTEVEGYRGRIEAQLMLGQYSDAVRDYTRLTAFVIPVHPDAQSTILAGYSARLAIAPDSVPALAGESFAYWWFFKYASAIHTLNHLLEVQPDNIYGNLFRGSSRLLQGQGATKVKGIADLEYALMLAPQSADVRFIIADAYTYGVPNPQRAFDEASLALSWGLDTPRVHAILGSSYNSFGNQSSAAGHIKTHIDLVTTELVSTSPISAGITFKLDLVPGRTYEIPVTVNAGETISITTSSKDFWDTILVLLAPDGTPILGADDTVAYFAAFEWTANTTGTFLLRVTSFESVSTGELVVKRN